MTLNGYQYSSMLFFQTGSKIFLMQISNRIPTEKFILSRDITFLSRWRLRYIMTAKQVNAAIDVLLVWQPVNYRNMLHHFM